MHLFLRNAWMDRWSITGKYGTAESASRPITARHFTGTDACHLIIICNIFRYTNAHISLHLQGITSPYL